MMTRLGDKLKHSIKDKGIRIPITSDMFLWTLQKSANKNDVIRDMHVSFVHNVIRISGSKKVLRYPVWFQVDLRPLVAKERILHIKLEQVRPLNWNWVHKMILNRPPFIHYEKEIITIDLNCIDKIKAVPIGTIQSFEIKDELLWVKLGI